MVKPPIGGEVREYSRLCDLTIGKDHRTFDLVKAILNEEIENEA